MYDLSSLPHLFLCEYDTYTIEAQMTKRYDKVVDRNDEHFPKSVSCGGFTRGGEGFSQN